MSVGSVEVEKSRSSRVSEEPQSARAKRAKRASGGSCWNGVPMLCGLACIALFSLFVFSSLAKTELESESTPRRRFPHLKEAGRGREGRSEKEGEEHWKKAERLLALLHWRRAGRPPRGLKKNLYLVPAPSYRASTDDTASGHAGNERRGAATYFRAAKRRSSFMQRKKKRAGESKIFLLRFGV